MKIHRLILGPIEVNCYILIDEDKKAIAIDPGAESKAILSLLAKEGATLKEILLTHTHYDHIGAIPDLMKDKDITLRVFHEESNWLYNPEKNLSLLLGETMVFPPVDAVFQDGETVGFGGMEMTVIHTPGHTPGSVCFYHREGILFSGDTLFAGSIGRTDFPGGNHYQLISSIRNRIFTLPGETVVYPGHGQSTKINKEMRENLFLR